jgi:hypothetical protein
MFDNLRLVDYFDRVDVLAHLVPHFVHLSKATNTDITVSEGLKVVAAAFTLLTGHDRGRQKKDPIFDGIYLGLKFLRHFNWHYCLGHLLKY